MRNIFILDNDIPNEETDKLLFRWAKKIEELGYEVSQIWENEDKTYEYDYGTKGINFSMINDTYEGIVLSLFEGCNDNSDIRVQVDHDFLSQNGYVEFIRKLIQ